MTYNREIIELEKEFDILMDKLHEENPSFDIKDLNKQLLDVGIKLRELKYLHYREFSDNMETEEEHHD